MITITFGTIHEGGGGTREAWMGHWGSLGSMGWHEECWGGTSTTSPTNPPPPQPHIAPTPPPPTQDPPPNSPPFHMPARPSPCPPMRFPSPLMYCPYSVLTVILRDGLETNERIRHALLTHHYSCMDVFTHSSLFGHKLTDLLLFSRGLGHGNIRGIGPRAFRQFAHLLWLASTSAQY